MSIGMFRVTEAIPAWKTVLDISDLVPQDSWMLVGGLMTQVHAGLAGLSSRATVDVDVLVDVLASSRNVGAVIRSLEKMGFEPQEPGLRGSAFHRMAKGDLIVDVLVADHLPAGRQKAARVNTWPMLETPGGAQAIERKTEVEIASETRKATVSIPSLIGALVLKCAAYATDRRNPHRHLEDAALLASLITDHAVVLSQLHGSDRKRLRKAADALSDPNEPSWLLLAPQQRIKGQDTMRILGS
ncbi:MAG: hypothetical protein IJ111_04490 [Eggerthellaceae bacterium]|nr:hypothetical protein [Eggerthellaceae bacterium]